MTADLLTENAALRDCLLAILGGAGRLPMQDETKTVTRPWLPQAMNDALDVAEGLLGLREADEGDGVLGCVGVRLDDPDWQGALAHNAEQIVKTSTGE